MEENVLEPMVTQEQPIIPDVDTASETPVAETPSVPEIIIGENLSDSDREEIYKRLGRPEAPSEYDLDGIVPETYNHELVDEFKKKAFEGGMSKENVRKMAEWYKEVETKQYEAINKSKQLQADQYVLELKRDFGTNFDQEIGNARKALDAYTDKAFKQYMDSTGLGNHPALVKAFARIGREMSEDTLVHSETATRLAADDGLRKAEINRLWSDKEFIKKYRSGDMNAVRRMNSLYGLDDPK